LATVAINLLSAYIRHQEAGLGCQPWPACYGQVGELEPPGDSPASVLTPTETAKRAHRTIATVLVGLVLLVVYQARTQRLSGLSRFLPHGIIAVILVLSAIGPASYLKTLPAVATANLLGGMALLGLVWMLRLSTLGLPADSDTRLRTVSRLALIMTVAQLSLGGWVSSNFAAGACRGPFSCAPLQEAGISSFWYLRELGLSAAGQIEIGGAQSLIQQAHHVGAVACLLVLVWTGISIIRRGGTAGLWGAGLLGLIVLQVGIGLGSLRLDMPIVLALAHNLIASSLLLVVLTLAYLSRGTRVARAKLR